MNTCAVHARACAVAVRPHPPACAGRCLKTDAHAVVAIQQADRIVEFQP